MSRAAAAATTAAATDAGAAGSTALDLAITGMTCASCANRIERKLNKVPGVSASVNYATEKASVRFGAGVSTDDLLEVVAKAGYAAALPAGPRPEASDPAGAPGVRVAVAVVLAVPVLVLAMVPGLDTTAGRWVALALATPVVAWAGLPFHRSALVNLRHGAATMDTLVSLGTLAAYLWSLVVLVGGLSAHVYVDSAAVVTALVLAGRYAEARAKRRAGDALHALLDLGAKDVAVLGEADGTGVAGTGLGDGESRIPLADLTVGRHFVVRPGERIATDGVVRAGRSAVDASMLTGEPVPVEVGEGDEVTGGCLNEGGRLVVEATRVGSETQLAQMARLVEDAQSGKAAAQRLADRVSAVFVPAVVLIALVTLVGWLIGGGTPAHAFTAAVAVLVVACPCALGLATPTALMVGTGRGARLGVLIRGPEALEQTRAVDVVVFDKTGTVTTGVLGVVSVTGHAETLRWAGALESASEHPVGRAIATAASQQYAALPGVEDFANEPGRGVRGTVAGRLVVAGRPALLADQGFELAGEVAGAVEAASTAGHTVVAVGWDGAVRGVVALADTVKPDAPAALARLRDAGLRLVLLTGDHESAARTVAAAVGISADDVIAGVLPAGKVEALAQLQARGHTVAMVGDGVNDAAALARADLGIALGTGTDVAIAAADLTLVRDDLGAVADAIALAWRTLATIRGNLVWAFGYNVAAIPLAAAGLLNPMIAGGAMAFSSVFVVGNSLRLRRFDPDAR